MAQIHYPKINKSLPAEMARRYGPETTVSNWRKRLIYSRCGSRDADMVVTGEGGDNR